MSPYESHWADDVYGTRASDLDDLQLSVDPSEHNWARAPYRSKSHMAFRLASAIMLTGAWIFVVCNGGLAILAPAAQAAFETVIGTGRDLAARFAETRAAETFAASNDSASAGATPVATLPEVPILQVAPDVAAVTPSPAAATDYAATAEASDRAEPDAPQRKEAVAAGLGPDLPNVLLSRLSKTDFKNAAYAIKAALSKTPDDATFSWPQKPSREQALFEVRFVQGAPTGCRRYVVTVTKARWSSTAAALESCGSVLARAG